MGGLFFYLGRADVDEEEYEPCSPLTCRKKEKEPVNLDEYYSTTAGLTGSALRSELNKIIRDHERYTYTCVWSILAEADEDEDNSENIIAIYSQRSIPKLRRDCGRNDPDSWNREHVWAKSHGFPDHTQHAYTDVHHLRPADRSINRDRSNYDFQEGGTQNDECLQCYVDVKKGTFEPPDAVKGEVARMLFYMAVRYEGNDESRTKTPDLKLVNESTKGLKDPTLGHISDLLKWNCAFPVSNRERKRNDIVQTWQGNRNPFIDETWFAESIWNYTCNKDSSESSINNSTCSSSRFKRMMEFFTKRFSFFRRLKKFFQ